MSEAVDPRRQFVHKARADVGLWLVMLALVGGSLLAAFHAPQVYAFPIVLLVALLQVAVLLAFFMQLRGARALVLLTCLYASLFVVVMFALTFEDLFTRV